MILLDNNETVPSYESVVPNSDQSNRRDRTHDAQELRPPPLAHLPNSHSHSREDVDVNEPLPSYYAATHTHTHTRAPTSNTNPLTYARPLAIRSDLEATRSQMRYARRNNRVSVCCCVVVLAGGMVGAIALASSLSKR